MNGTDVSFSWAGGALPPLARDCLGAGLHLVFEVPLPHGPELRLFRNFEKNGRELRAEG